MPVFSKPQWIQDFKETKLWSVSFAQEKFPDCEFKFYITSKAEEGGYYLYGFETDANAAFKLRRELVKQLDNPKLFLRAKRQNAFENHDSDADLDFFRDRHNEGVGIEDIPRHLRAGYLAYQRGRRTAR